MRTLLCIFLILLPFCAMAQNPVSITITPSSTEIKQGDQLGLLVTLKNTYSAAAPVVVKATVTFKDAKGTLMPTASGSANITIIRPVNIQKLALTIPSPLVYVANTAKYNGKTVTANQAQGTLTINLSKDLAEGASGIIELKLAMQGTTTRTSTPSSVTISVN